MNSDLRRQRSARGSVFHSFAGARASVADHFSLARARERLAAGEDAEAVRLDTGWHRGAEGRWRFEISDADARLVGFRGTTGGQALREATLAEVLDHPRLFAAYPHLAAIRVAARIVPGSVISGVFTPAYPARGDAQAVSARAEVEGPTAQDVLSALLHEVQHAVQDHEGFAPGGAPKGGDYFLPTGVVQQLRLLSEQADALGLQSQFEKARSLRERAAALRRKEAFHVYRRLAGEVEARNTQARRLMTDDERRSSPPTATADVPPQLVVVNQDRGGERDWLSAEQRARSLAAWAGDTKARNADGSLRVLYHGTSAQFDVFSDRVAPEQRGSMGESLGLYFTPSAEAASAYATAEGGQVLPVYLSLQKPLVIDSKMVNRSQMSEWLGIDLGLVRGAPERAEPYWFFKNGGAYDGREDARVGDVVIEAMLRQGYDGAIFREVVDGREVEVFMALGGAQVKSALGNRGTFSARNPDIRESAARTPPDPLAGRDLLRDEAGSPLLVFRDHAAAEALVFSQVAQGRQGPQSSAEPAMEKMEAAFIEMRRPAFALEDTPFLPVDTLQAALGAPLGRAMAAVHRNWVRAGDESDQICLHATDLLGDARFVDAAVAAGYDGAIFGDEGGGRTFRVFDAGQAVPAFRFWQSQLPSSARQSVAPVVTFNGVDFEGPAPANAGLAPGGPPPAHVQRVSDAIRSVLGDTVANRVLGVKGGIFVVEAAQLPPLASDALIGVGGSDLIESARDIARSSEEQFYRGLSAAVARAPASVEVEGGPAWWQYLQRLAMDGSAGFSADALIWSGLGDWLDAQAAGGALSREGLLGFADGLGLRVVPSQDDVAGGATAESPDRGVRDVSVVVAAGRPRLEEWAAGRGFSPASITAARMGLQIAWDGAMKELAGREGRVELGRLRLTNMDTTDGVLLEMEAREGAGPAAGGRRLVMRAMLGYACDHGYALVRALDEADQLVLRDLLGTTRQGLQVGRDGALRITSSARKAFSRNVLLRQARPEALDRWFLEDEGSGNGGLRLTPDVQRAAAAAAERGQGPLGTPVLLGAGDILDIGHGVDFQDLARRVIERTPLRVGQEGALGGSDGRDLAQEILAGEGELVTWFQRAGYIGTRDSRQAGQGALTIFSESSLRSPMAMGTAALDGEILRSEALVPLVDRQMVVAAASEASDSDDLEEILAEHERALARAREALGDPAEGQVLRKGEQERWALLLRDATEPGAWRLQYFDTNGFSGHATLAGREVAQSRAIEQGYVARDPGALDRVWGTASFQRGLFASDLLQRAQRDAMPFQEVALTLAQYDAASAALAAIADASSSTQAFYSRSADAMVMVADRVPVGQERAVFLHETMHRWAGRTLGLDGMERLAEQVRAWETAPAGSAEYGIFGAASARAQRHENSDVHSEELVAYAVEEAVSRGIKPSLEADQATAEHWLGDVVATIQGFVMQATRGALVDIGPQELVDLAYALAQMENPKVRAAVRQELGAKAVAVSDHLRQIVAPLGEPTESPGFKAWSRGLRVVKVGSRHAFKHGEGVVLEAFHGTVRDFEDFRMEEANADGNLGRGIYTTTSAEDVSRNYACLGGDMLGRLTDRAEQIENAAWDAGEDLGQDEAWEAALSDMGVAHDGVVLPVYVRLERPAVIGGRDGMMLDYQECPATGDETGLLADFLMALYDLLGRESRVSSMLSARLTADLDGCGEVGLEEVLSALWELLVDEVDPNHMGGEVFRETLEALGYDGIIDCTVRAKFSHVVNNRVVGGMAGLHADTVHALAFSPTQVASRMGSTWKRESAPQALLKSNLSADTAIRRKEATPAAQVLILVHPGSACGSADFNLGTLEAQCARQSLVRELDGWRGAIVVMDGDLSDELERYPVLDLAIDQALNRARRAGLLAERHDAQDPGQIECAARLAASLQATARSHQFTVTGAWVEPGNGGCVGSVVERLRNLGCHAVVGKGAVSLCDDQVEAERGEHAMRGN